MIDFSIVREIKEAAELLLQLPDKLVHMVMDPVVTYYERRERIRKYSELATLREIAKSLQDLYFTKGDLIEWVLSIKHDPQGEYAGNFITGFPKVAEQISNIIEMLREGSFSKTALVIESIPVLERSKRAYDMLAMMPYEKTFEGETIDEIARILDSLMHHGTDLIEKLDKHRIHLDCMYG